MTTKKYYQEHKEEIKEYKKKYYQEHKEEIKEKTKITNAIYRPCVCGMMVRSNHKSRHLKSDTHINLMKKINTCN